MGKLSPFRRLLSHSITEALKAGMESTSWGHEALPLLIKTTEQGGSGTFLSCFMHWPRVLSLQSNKIIHFVSSPPS